MSTVDPERGDDKASSKKLPSPPDDMRRLHKLGIQNLLRDRTPQVLALGFKGSRTYRIVIGSYLLRKQTLQMLSYLAQEEAGA